ncbi:uncharacterized protein LOC126848589 [Cataglyphis hispanica]|uniref:uncharacterized protein LOC126848589 n=1 Tax=Cataglyphis hispanica TaxID=1086592 RepID=UPI00217FB476|nr:uncharacterized protein LOC126848589 [Cataglyphis hispanica]
MHLHRSEAHWIALILIITCGISWASTQCKTIVMDVHMKKCRLGVRAKRGLEKFDLRKYDEKYEWKRQEQADYPRVNDSASHGVPQKRQLSSGLVAGDITLPIVLAAINDAAKARAHIVSGTGYYDPGPRPIFDRSGYYSLVPYPLGKRSVTPFRVPAFNDDLDLNDEELDELYKDMYERSPRASKEETRKVFLETASKCCQNVDKCLKETTHIPCLASQMS